MNGLFGDKNDTDTVLKIFQGKLAKNLVKAFEDKIEKNRELALNILEMFIKKAKGKQASIDKDII